MVCNDNEHIMQRFTNKVIGSIKSSVKIRVNSDIEGL